MLVKTVVLTVVQVNIHIFRILCHPVQSQHMRMLHPLMNLKFLLYVGLHVGLGYLGLVDDLTGVKLVFGSQTQSHLGVRALAE